MTTPRERQIAALMHEQGVKEFEAEHAVTARQRQAAEAKLQAVVEEICEQQGHVWHGRVCGNCHARWEDVADRS